MNGFSEGFSVVKFYNGNYCWIDTKGNILAEGFEWCDNFLIDLQYLLIKNEQKVGLIKKEKL